MGSYHTDHRAAGPRIASAAVAALALSFAVFATAQQDASALGAPDFWPWLLTGLQVVALWSAGRRLWWGWLLGGFVQVPWIAYALVTDQIGFIPGCVISAAVQIYSFLRSASIQRFVEVST
ncbi:MAG TPA: hypothetical protein VFS66_15200 [Acidimicrobiia bacterium]|nr:hypothetical protein [Acidimicrobiia bacterium]